MSTYACSKGTKNVHIIFVESNSHVKYCSPARAHVHTSLQLINYNSFLIYTNYLHHFTSLNVTSCAVLTDWDIHRNIFLATFNSSQFSFHVAQVIFVLIRFATYIKHNFCSYIRSNLFSVYSHSFSRYIQLFRISGNISFCKNSIWSEYTWSHFHTVYMVFSHNINFTFVENERVREREREREILLKKWMNCVL